jgi:predicted ATPase
MAEQLLRLAQSVQDSSLLVLAHRAMGTYFYTFGEDFVQAREHFAQVLALYNPRQHASLGLSYGVDPGAVGRNFTAGTLWQLGYPDQALKTIHDSLPLTRELSHAYSLAGTLLMVAQVAHFRREEHITREYAEEALTLSIEHGLTPMVALAQIWKGWALTEQGGGQEGISHIQQGLKTTSTTGTEISKPYYLSMLAEAYGKTGQPQEGLTTLAEALDAVGRTGERFYEPELHRLKGELQQQCKVQGSKFQVEEEAEACFQHALEVARGQRAKSLELRATMSLACLWQKQGKNEEAHQLLSEIYSWFTEGFDTPDLTEAKRLLGELS